MSNQPLSPPAIKLNNKALWSLRIYAAISIVMFAITIWRIVEGILPINTALITLIIGLILGGLFSRISRWEWDEESQEVTSTLDVVGGILLVVYLLITFMRGRIIDQWVHDAHRAAAISIAFAAALMAGRVIVSRRRIREILAAMLP